MEKPLPEPTPSAATQEVAERFRSLVDPDDVTSIRQTQHLIYVERYLDRISNGTIPDDRRSAMTELQSLVAESRSAQMSFGAMGFPILLNILKEDREDVELVRGALETFVSTLTPIETSQGPKTEVQLASVNSNLLSRETENISLLLSLLSEEDFYVRYYTIQLLTALLTNSLKRCPVTGSNSIAFIYCLPLYVLGQSNVCGKLIC